MTLTREQLIKDKEKYTKHRDYLLKNLPDYEYQIKCLNCSIDKINELLN